MMRDHLSKTALILVVCVFLLQPFLCAQPLDAEKIIQAFQDSYNWSERVAFHAESVDSYTTTPTRQHFEESTFYNDHGRQTSTLSMSQMRHAHSGEAESPGQRRRTLFSEEKIKGYFHELDLPFSNNEDHSDPWILRSYEDGPAASYFHLGGKQSLATFLGMDSLFSNKRIPDLLEPDKVNLREKSLDGQKSIVVETKVPEGHMEIWLSPEKGYSLQKYILTKEAGKDLDSDGEIYESENYSDASLGRLIPVKRTIIEVMVEEELYDEESGYFIPKKHIWTYRNENEDDEIFYENVSVCTLTEVDLNPNFEALKAFDFPVPDDTLVFLHKKNGQYMAGLKWRDGKFIIDLDHKIHDERFLAAVDGLNAGSEAIQKSSTKLSLQLNNQQNRQPVLKRHFSPLVVAAAVLCALVSGALLLYPLMRVRNRNMKEKGE